MKFGGNVHLIAIYKKGSGLFYVTYLFKSYWHQKYKKITFPQILKRFFTPFSVLGSENSSAIRKSVQNMTGVEISVRFEALSQARHYFSLN